MPIPDLQELKPTSLQPETTTLKMDAPNTPHPKPEKPGALDSQEQGPGLACRAGKQGSIELLMKSSRMMY